MRSVYAINCVPEPWEAKTARPVDSAIDVTFPMLLASDRGIGMAATPKKIRWITKDEMKSIVDKRARSVLKISGTSFIRNRKSGAYAKLDADMCPGIIELALLAPSSKIAKSSARKNR